MTAEARSLCARNVKRLRVDAGLALVDLAQACGLAVSTLLAIEEGVSDVGIDELDRLAARLGVPIRALFLDETAGHAAGSRARAMSGDRSGPRSRVRRA